MSTLEDYHSINKVITCIANQTTLDEEEADDHDDGHDEALKIINIFVVMMITCIRRFIYH